ncbi:hypothetical protein [Pseudoduganella sp. GCM10020061]|jgi:hypothetical protein|uniref:hypothetical protein n=1 Tax=Pseudoduganella sp. GCM10020061 TaxID=3317345 RepID=UPI00362E6C59
MNIARNMEAVFLAATLLAVTTTGASAAAQARLDAQPVLDGKVHTVVVTAKRLAPADLLVAAK